MANANDDIIFVLHKAMQDRKLQSKAKWAKYELDALHQEIDPLVAQLPHVRCGAFSSGVNAFKEQVEVLKNTRDVYHKRHGRE